MSGCREAVPASTHKPSAGRQLVLMLRPGGPGGLGAAAGEDVIRQCVRRLLEERAQT